MSDKHTLPYKIEPWDGRVVDANDMYVDTNEVLHILNHHAELVEALRETTKWADQFAKQMEMYDVSEEAKEAVSDAQTGRRPMNQSRLAREYLILPYTTKKALDFLTPYPRSKPKGRMIDGKLKVYWVSSHLTPQGVKHNRLRLFKRRCLQ